jgi:hypothetical protein
MTNGLYFSRRRGRESQPLLNRSCDITKNLYAIGSLVIYLPSFDVDEIAQRAFIAAYTRL